MGSRCAGLSDRELASRLRGLAWSERRRLGELVAHLAELDRRRLYADLGYPSLFAYCTRALGCSESAASKRVAAAAAARRFPAVQAMLESGKLHLEAVAALAPYLKEENHEALLAEAAGKPKRELELLVASLSPRPETSGCVRRVPASRAEGPASAVREAVEVVTSRRMRFSFTGSLALFAMVERSRELLRHKRPGGRLEEVFMEALEIFLDRKDPERRLARAPDGGRQDGPDGAGRPAPDANGRRIPQRVKNEVWRRDGGRCVFKAPDGAPCLERGGLEFDHVVPWALGGRSDDPRNVRLLCRAHNLMFARRIFGEKLEK